MERLFGLGAEDRDYRPPSRYSTDLSAAWEVVEEMRRRGWAFSVVDRLAYGHDELAVGFERCEPGGVDGWARARTLPEAVCRAALMALAAPSAGGEDGRS